jgi:hypothetical protein
MDLGFSQAPDKLRETCRQFLEEEVPMLKVLMGEASR